MLDSRYIHLHEALGLGPMWLSRSAHLHSVIQSPAIVDSSTMVSAQEDTSLLSQRSETKLNTEVSARISTLKMVGSKTLTPLVEESVNESKVLVYTTESWQQKLMGSIPQVKVMAMSVCASPRDITTGQLFSGEDGQLLQKMFAAIQLSMKDVYLTTWLKDLPDFNPIPPEETVQAAFTRVQAEYLLAGKPLLLLLGDFFQRADVQHCINLLDSSIQYFMIPHPMKLIRYPELKRATWDTLQVLQRNLLN